MTNDNQVSNTDNRLYEIIAIIQDMNNNDEYIQIYELLVTNAQDYSISSDVVTKDVLHTLRMNIKPQGIKKYGAYHSIIKYEEGIKSRALHNLKKLLTHLFNELNEVDKETDKQLIERLTLEVSRLTEDNNRFRSLREISLTDDYKEEIENSIQLTNLERVYDIDIFSSMKQRVKETDLIITRTYEFTRFASGLLIAGLKLPRGSIIYAKGGDGATRFVRLLQGAGDLIKCAKELWSKNRITLAVVSSSGEVLRMNDDKEAARIITEGINQTVTTLINQAKTKSNTQVITSVLGVFLRSGKSLEEAINKMHVLLDTEKTATINQDLIDKAIVLMNDGRVNKWFKMNLCPDYEEIEITNAIKTLLGIGRGNKNKKCKATKYHRYYETLTKCPDCDYIKN